MEAKHFERDYRERFTTGGILVRDFGDQGAAGQESSTRHLKIRTFASNTAVYPGSRLTLTVELELRPGMHVYAPGVSGEYIPVSWKMAESKAWINFDPEWPRSRNKRLKAIRQTVPVFENKFRVMRDLKMAQARDLYPAAAENKLSIKGDFRYQACDARVCYPPETVPLEWILEARPQDRERAPADLRKVK
ncbi:MAG: protein-disulfide reductase DsbD family protein [Bryobacteraceae bacterium]